MLLGVGFCWFLLDDSTQNCARCRNFNNEDTTPGSIEKSTLPPTKHPDFCRNFKKPFLKIAKK